MGSVLYTAESAPSRASALADLRVPDPAPGLAVATLSPPAKVPDEDVADPGVRTEDDE